MRYLLNGVYGLVMTLALPWLLWQALRTGKYRAGWAAKLWGLAPRCDDRRTRIWLHAVSVGEVQLLRALVPALEAALPGYECVVSTTTKTGLQVAQQLFPEHCVFYAPLDFSWAVARAVRRVHPSLMVLMELELWPNWIAELQRRGVPVAVVNGRLSDGSFRGYRRLAWGVRGTMAQLDWVGAQSDEYAGRFVTLGVPPERVSVTGSIKCDLGARPGDVAGAAALAAQVGLADDDRVVLAGSTQDPEERIVLRAMRSLWADDERARLILVPRHPERFDEVARWLDREQIVWARRSAYAAERPWDPAQDRRWRVLLVDTVGELGRWWGTAQVGFVGGSLGSRGGQNMMEPAAWGVAICFGPNTRNFRDIVALLLGEDAAEVVRDEAELARFLRRCWRDPEFARRRGAAARATVLGQAGATEKTVRQLSRLLATPLPKPNYCSRPSRQLCT